MPASKTTYGPNGGITTTGPYVTGAGFEGAGQLSFAAAAPDAGGGAAANPGLQGLQAAAGAPVGAGGGAGAAAGSAPVGGVPPTTPEASSLNGLTGSGGGGGLDAPGGIGAMTMGQLRQGMGNRMYPEISPGLAGLRKAAY